MIEYEINKPSLFSTVSRTVLSLVHSPGQQQAPSPPSNVDLTPSRRWGKFPYIRWIEQVKAEWAVGDFVCPIGVPVKDGQAPYYYGQIEGINELHYMADVDVLLNEPKALLVRHSKGDMVSYCPRALRKFTDAERTHVLLRDKPAPTIPTTH